MQCQTAPLRERVVMVYVFSVFRPLLSVLIFYRHLNPAGEEGVGQPASECYEERPEFWHVDAVRFAVDRVTCLSYAVA